MAARSRCARTHSIRNRLARSRNLSKVHIMVSIVICHLLHVRHAYAARHFPLSCFCMWISVRVWRLMRDNVHCTGKSPSQIYLITFKTIFVAQQNLCANLSVIFKSYPMRTWLGAFINSNSRTYADVSLTFELYFLFCCKRIDRRSADTN